MIVARPEHALAAGFFDGRAIVTWIVSVIDTHIAEAERRVVARSRVAHARIPARSTSTRGIPAWDAGEASGDEGTSEAFQQDFGRHAQTEQRSRRP
jgi:hypothetical protein